MRHIAIHIKELTGSNLNALVGSATNPVKMLRLLQDQRFERVGGNETIQTDVRIITATNQPLERMVEEGTFRSDLLYRINGVTISIPPLRERGDDVKRLLQQMLAHWPEHPSVALVTTDGFLYPNAELERRGLMARKGFPESYDRRALLRFVMDIKSGKDEVHAPTYSHLVYDVVPGETVAIRRPDIVIIEGLNVLQPARVRADGRTGLAISDFFDFSVYVDAATADIRRWYVERFLRLRETAFRNPASYFAKYAHLTEDEAVAEADRIWDEINGPNLKQNVQPTRGRATLVLRKAADHSVRFVRLRKL